MADQASGGIALRKLAEALSGKKKQRIRMGSFILIIVFPSEYKNYFFNGCKSLYSAVFLEMRNLGPAPNLKLGTLPRAGVTLEDEQEK